MIYLNRYLALLGPMIFLLGCSSPSTIQSVTRDGEDLMRYRTYTMGPSSSTPAVPGVNPAKIMAVQQVVEQELQQRGFQRVSTPTADMLVLIETEISGSREKGGFSIGFGTGSYSRSGGSSVGVATGPIGAANIEQSTLTVRIVEPVSQELLWVGWIDKLEDKKFTTEEFKEKIRQIMAQLPSR